MTEKQYRWYVYQLIDPRNKEVFYIGKGTGKRIHEHEREALKGVCSHKCHKINKIHKAGFKIIKQKVAYFNDESYAYQFESELISKTPNLTNVVGRMERVVEPLQLNIQLTFGQSLLEVAKEAYQTIEKYMGEFAYWYLNTEGGKHKVNVESNTMFSKMGLEMLYNKLFPKFLQDIKNSLEVENTLKKELKHYGVQYGC